MDISIHTSAREVTGGKVFIKRPLRNFNPHFRKGSDEMSVLITYLSYISIHTSAREVTDTAFIPINLLPNFNPHFRKGSDKITVWINTAKHNFNPHFRKGSDCPRSCSWCSGNISIHTSAREVTSAVLLSGRHIHISIHTSAREVTALHPILSRQYGNFNPHFRKGSDSSRQS